MRPLRVDFARPSPVRARIAYFIAAALGALAIWQADLAWESLRVLRLEQGKTSALQQELDTLTRRANAQSVPASAPAYEKDARSLANIAAFDVGGPLRAIESVQIPGAKVTRINVDAAARTAEIELEVATADLAAAYVAELNAGEPQPRWLLARVSSQTGNVGALVRADFP